MTQLYALHDMLCYYYHMIDFIVSLHIKWIYNIYKKLPIVTNTSVSINCRHHGNYDVSEVRWLRDSLTNSLTCVTHATERLISFLGSFFPFCTDAYIFCWTISLKSITNHSIVCELRRNINNTNRISQVSTMDFIVSLSI